jgi:hypothetical protein
MIIKSITYREEVRKSEWARFETGSWRILTIRAAAGSGWNSSILILLLESCLQTCMTYTIAVFTVNNS